MESPARAILAWLAAGAVVLSSIACQSEHAVPSAKSAPNQPMLTGMQRLQSSGGANVGGGGSGGTGLQNPPLVLEWATADVPEYQRSLAVDSAGNVYLVGGTGDSRCRITKYDSTGKRQWAQTVESESVSCWYTAVAVDRLGNAYAAGVAGGAGDVIFGNGVWTGQWGSAGTRLLLVKYDSRGDAQWAVANPTSDETVDNEFSSSLEQWTHRSRTDGLPVDIPVAAVCSRESARQESACALV